MANFYKPTAKSKISKEPITVSIGKLDINGVGIARWQNKPLFIAGALPEEIVTVKIIEQKNKYARAKLVNVNRQSEHRVLPNCKHFGVCGGCDLQMLSLEAQLLFKQQKIDELFSRSFTAGDSHSKTLSAKQKSRDLKSQSLPWQEPIKSEPWHYRRKARIGVQFDKNSQATIGFRQKSTNQLIAIKSCPVLVKPLNDIFPILKALIAQLSVTSAIGHIEVVQADLSDKNTATTVEQSNNAVVVIRQLKPMNDEDINLWQSYANQYAWHVVIDDGNKQAPLFIDQTANNTNNNGNSTLSYSLPDNQKIYFDSSDFIQINHQVNITMIEQALAWLKPSVSDHVLDLFCGLGNFSLALAKHVQRVIGVEGVQVMVDKATENADINGVDNCQFYQADLNSDWLSKSWAKVGNYQKVLLDPARAGAEQAVKQVALLKIPTVLYVSCDPTTLARDSVILVSQGYKIEKISLMDMFSQTKHVETMVLFTL